MGNILRKIVRKQKAVQLELADENLKQMYNFQGIPYKSIRERRKEKQYILFLNDLNKLLNGRYN